MVERLYWERENADHAVYPEVGGMLDQDDHLMTDLGTYGWLVGFANNILDRDEAVQDALKKAKSR